MSGIRIPINLGCDLSDGREVFFGRDSFRKHVHMVGATGAGKSTAILSLLHPLMLETTPGDQACVFVIDPLGGLSRDLLRLIADPRYSTDDLRDRLVYVEPAREDVVLPFNPLTHTSEANRYYQVMRAIDIVLRAWDAQELRSQPRLANWLFNAFYTAAAIGIPIAMCYYLLHPGSAEHTAILERIPADYRNEWEDLVKAKGEAVRILESTRNRLKPFFRSPNLNRMFGTQRSLFDCQRFIRERRIVILNLGRYGKMPGFAGETIGGLALNEILETASSMSATEGREAVDPTYVVMDEFQKFVGPDVEDALPTVRQMGLRFVLAHQSFSQLQREDVDLTQMIFQAQTRFMFANYGDDADRMADELAKMTFDPMRIKHRQTAIRQLITGHRQMWLESQSSTTTASSAHIHSAAEGRGRTHTGSSRPGLFGFSDACNVTATDGRTHANSDGQTFGRSQANVPIHVTFQETTGLTFNTFEEWAVDWGQRLRKLRTGEAFLQRPDDEAIQKLKIHAIPAPESSQSRDAVDELVERNFASDFFISAAEADREAESCRRQLFSAGPIRLLSDDAPSTQVIEAFDEAPDEEQSAETDSGPFEI